MKRVAVESLGVPFLELWKKLPRFCLDSSTVGGLFSSGTMEDSSTLGGGKGPPCTSLGVTAVVGVRVLCLLSSAGRFGWLVTSWSIPIAALDREMKLRPAATAPDTASETGASCEVEGG